MRVGVAIRGTSPWPAELSSRDRGLQQLQLARIRVEPGAHAEREGPLVVDVPDRESRSATGMPSGPK